MAWHTWCKLYCNLWIRKAYKAIRKTWRQRGKEWRKALKKQNWIYVWWNKRWSWKFPPDKGEETPQSVRLNPSTHVRSQGWWYILAIPVLGGKARQSPSERLSQKEKPCGQFLRKNTQGWPLASTYLCITLQHIHTHLFQVKNACQAYSKRISLAEKKVLTG